MDGSGTCVVGIVRVNTSVVVTDAGPSGVVVRRLVSVEVLVMTNGVTVETVDVELAVDVVVTVTVVVSVTGSVSVVVTVIEVVTGIVAVLVVVFAYVVVSFWTISWHAARAGHLDCGSRHPGLHARLLRAAQRPGVRVRGQPNRDAADHHPPRPPPHPGG